MVDYKKIASAKRKVVQAQHAMTDLMAQQFPDGARVEWMHGHHRQVGTVKGAANRHGLRAENWRTGKTVRVSLYSIMEAGGVKLPGIWP